MMIADSLSSSNVAMLIVIFVLLIILIFCSIAEMGLSRISTHKASALSDKGLPGGKALAKLVNSPEKWVNPLLLTVNTCQTVQATMTGIVAGDLFGGLGVAVGVFINVLLFFVLAEALPKTYAVLYPQRAALGTARPILALVSFPPLQMISRGLIWLTNVLVRGKGLERGPFVSEQELLAVVSAAADDGVVEHEEQELIHSVIEFGDTVTREVMVPRPDMVTVDNDATVTVALDIAIENGVSRLPVLAAGDADDVIGLVYAKDLMRLERSGSGATMVRDVVRPVHVIPENKPVNRLMREMQANKFHLAVVADEYGAIAGLITLEDCLEELVGEIVDEHDDEEVEVIRLPNGDYVVEGGVSVSDINDLLDLDLPDDDWETVGGFMFGTLEHVPVIGETVDFDGWRFSAQSVVGRRVRLVQISVIPQDGHVDSSESHGVLDG
jgi:putative hemolysin